MEAEPEIVESSLPAVLPSVAIRGVVLAAIFVGFAYLYLFHLWGWTRSVLGPVAEVRIPLTLGAGVAVILVVLGVAGRAYSRRRYELTDADGETLVSLRYVSGADRLGDRLASLVNFDIEGSRAEGTESDGT